MFKFLAGATIGVLSIYSLMTTVYIMDVHEKKEKKPDQDTLDDTWAYITDKLNINN